MIAIRICYNINGSVGYRRVCECSCGGKRIAAATMVVGIMMGIEMETILEVVLPSRCHHFTPTSSTTTGYWPLQ